MKKLIYVNLLVLAVVAIAFAPSATTTVTESRTITGTAQGIFPAGTTLGAVSIDGLQLGTGVIIDPSSSAVGDFHALLIGRTLLGQPQQITVEGKVSEGANGEIGTPGFSGIAILDFGDGTPLRKGIPFRVAVAPGSLMLTIGSTKLPATLTEGSISIE